MKKLGIGIMMSFVFSSCMAQSHFKEEIGTVTRGVAKITADTTQIKGNWEKAILTGSGTTVKLNNLELIPANKGVYILKTTDSLSKLKAAVQLVLIKDKLYEAKESNGGGITITCSGCTSDGASSDTECQPTLNESSMLWYCSDCSTNNCAKSITVSSSSILGGSPK